MTANSTIGKRKRAAASGSKVPSANKQPRLQYSAASRTSARKKRQTIRATARLTLSSGDDEDDVEDEDEDDEDFEPSPPATTVAAPVAAAVLPAPPKPIEGKKLRVLLSLFCGPTPVTGESVIPLEQLGSFAEVRSFLGRSFQWELQRANVPADLNFMRINCTGPDKDGPLRGVWPIATAEVYREWAEGLMAQSWERGKFARVQVVGLTNHQLQRDSETYRDFFALDLNPVPFWFVPLVEEMDGVKWAIEGPARPEE